MGWASGSDLCAAVIALANEHVPKESKPAFYAGLIKAFENHDCDTLGELEDDAEFKQALKVAHPRWYAHEE